MSTRRYYVHNRNAPSSSSNNDSESLPNYTRVIELNANDYRYNIKDLANHYLKEYQFQHQIRVEFDTASNDESPVVSSANESLKLSSIVNSCLEDRDDVFVKLREYDEKREQNDHRAPNTGNSSLNEQLKELM